MEVKMQIDIIEILKSILFGIVEGITEWLPISSTGHLIILNEFISLKASEGFLEMFDVVIQLGAIVAVIIIFFKQIWPFGKSGEEEPLKKTGVLSYVKKDIFFLWLKILVACIPAILAMPFDDQFEKWFRNPTCVSIVLIVFGIGFIIIESMHKGKEAKVNSLLELSFKLAFVIGIFQFIAAVFPGTSRSGATILGALLLGVSRKVAAEFTFFLAIPAMIGASLFKLLKFGFTFTSTEILLLVIAMVTAFLVSVFVIKFLMSYIKKHDFKVFGWYRIALGILVLAFMIFR